MTSGRASRREVVGYCLFDFANSSYTTLISTVAFSVYFRQAVVGSADGRGDLLWSFATATAHGVLILTAPLLGAVADYSGRKKLFLLLTTVQTVAACALLGLVGPGDVALGFVLFVVGSIGFEGGYVFYNAFLPEVSTPQTIGRISGLSWGVGFIGGLAALFACAPLLRPLVGEDGALLAESVAGYRLSFVVVAAFFALFSIPTFLFLRETGARQPPPSLAGYAVAGVRRVTGTIARLRRYRDAGRFAAASLCYTGAIETVIKFSAIYATVTFALSGKELSWLFIAANVAAVPGTIAAGWFADRLGSRTALGLTLAGWFVLMLVASGVGSKTALWGITPAVAIGVGSTQSIGRALMAQLAPPSQESEFFGFYLLCNKLGSILGLLSFGAVSWLTGSQRWALVAVAPLFLVGLLLIRGVDPERAARAAADPAAASPLA